MLFDLRRNRKYLLAVIVAVILIAVLIIIWKMGSPPDETDRIYTDVYIHGVAVGGMTGEEAEAALSARFQSELEARTVRYVLNGEFTDYSFGDFGARFDFSRLVTSALDYSHKPTRRFSRAFGKHEIDAPPMFIFSTERLECVMRELSEALDILPRNAALKREYGAITLTEESAGYGIKMTEAVSATRDILNSLSDGIVELSTAEAAPLYTTADFDFTVSVIGSFETAVNSEAVAARSRNIERASARINNRMVYPGEVFSAGEAIAANSPESGYETAIVLVRGEPAEDVGGGVCQVVTTLYNAVLFAELEVIQRNNHSAPVSYAPEGFDATVAGDYFDLKFINNTPSPILITSRVENEKLIIEIYGNETRAAERTIYFKANVIETIPHEPYREVIDPTVPRGSRIITLEAQDGCRVELVKIISINGTEVEQIRINSSLYRPLPGVIAIGAG